LLADAGYRGGGAGHAKIVRQNALDGTERLRQTLVDPQLDVGGGMPLS